MARQREGAGRNDLTFEGLLQFAQDEGDAYRARNPQRARAPRNAKASASVQYVESNSDPAGPIEGDAEMFGLLPDWSDSRDSSEMPTTVDDDAGLVLYGESHVPAPRLAHATGFTQRSRPGWQSRGYSPRERLMRLICFVCYAIGHVASQCNCPVRDMARVKRNFDALTQEEKSKVPRLAYERAIAFLQPLEGSTGPPAPDQVPPTVRASDNNENADTKN